MDDIEKEKLIEKLAEIEHQQWVEWSQQLARTEKVSVNRIARWKTLWIPYAELSEENKALDRVWAMKVLRLIQPHL